MGQPAPGGRNWRVPAGSVLDFVRFQGANGESGGDDLNSPRGGLYRDRSRTPCGCEYVLSVWTVRDGIQ